MKTAIVLTAVPFSLIGAVWLLWWLGYNLSIAVWVGMIALMGLDAETGVFMLLYLDLAYEERVRAGTLRTRADLDDAIVHGAVKRVRPKLMTVVAAFMGTLPIMWSTGAGADVMKRIAGADGRGPRDVVRARAARLPGAVRALARARPRRDVTPPSTSMTSMSSSRWMGFVRWRTKPASRGSPARRRPFRSR
jgi:hypothetical protein